MLSTSPYSLAPNAHSCRGQLVDRGGEIKWRTIHVENLPTEYLGSVSCLNLI